MTWSDSLSDIRSRFPSSNCIPRGIPRVLGSELNHRNPPAPDQCQESSVLNLCWAFSTLSSFPGPYPLRPNRQNQGDGAFSTSAKHSRLLTLPWQYRTPAAKSRREKRENRSSLGEHFRYMRLKRDQDTPWDRAPLSTRDHRRKQSRPGKYCIYRRCT